MTGPVSSRAAWAAAVAAWSPPASLRPAKGTLLVLARLMRVDGTLQRGRDELADAARLPRRTLERHLRHAVEVGWLTHAQRGQKYVLPLYQAAFPDTSQRAIRGALRGGLSAPSGCALRTGLSAPLSGALQTESEPSGEAVAVDERRDRRTDPVPSRAAAEPRPRRTAEQGGHAAGRPRQHVPHPRAAAAGGAGRSTGVGTGSSTTRHGSAAEARPQWTAAAAGHPRVDVAASRGDHQSAPASARDPPAGRCFT